MRRQTRSEKVVHLFEGKSESEITRGERERRSLGRQGCIKGCACAVAAVTDCTWRDGRLPLDQRNGTLALTSGSCATVTLAFETEILIRFIRSERGREAAMTAEAKKKDL